jgi:formamidopyrimidine-DNA glycosylase
VSVPELPEAETIARQLRAEVLGARIVGVSVQRPMSVRPHSTRAFRALVRGRTVTDVERRGKCPLLRLGTDCWLIVRLGMSGRLLVGNGPTRRPLHTRVALRFRDGRELRFVDPRAFGWLSAECAGEADSLSQLSRLGPEPLSRHWTPEMLAEALAGRRAGIERVLMEGRAVAGIGKIYADEACFRARIHPETPAGSLTSRQIERLHQAIKDVLSEAIKHCGTSAADRAYVDFYGSTGNFQNFLHVYQRTGKPCKVCGARIRRVPLGRARGIHFCPRCQRPRKK